MSYLDRELRSTTPDIRLLPYRSRFSERPVLRHLTVPFALAAFALGLIVKRVDVVHLNVAPRGSTWRKLLFGIVAKILGSEIVLHLHGSGYDDFYASLPPWKKSAVRVMFGQASAVVALSPYWKRFIVDVLLVPSGDVVEIPNGVPAPIANATPPIPRTVPSIVALGLVGHRKGTDVLLQAVASLKSQAAPFKLTIGGNGDVEQAKALADELQLADSVEFLGWVGEQAVDELLRNADIFVLPSRAENQPVSILEAMARSVAVVSTTVGAIPEQVVSGTTGILTPPGEAEPLAQALSALLADPDKRTRMGLAGERRFRERFSVASCATSFAVLYRRLA